MEFNCLPVVQFKSFESVLSHHCLFLFDDDYKMDEVFDCFESPDEVLLHIHSLKEQGNSFFKQNFFSDALKTYLKAIKFLCVITSVISDSLQAQNREILVREIAIPLHLNVAMCSIKLSSFKEAILFSSMVLGMDHVNVKALYRRGLSYLKTNCLQEARKDLSKAKKLDGKNEEIDRMSELVEKKIKGKANLSQESQNPSTSLHLSEFSGPKDEILDQLYNANNNKGSMVRSKDIRNAVCEDERDTALLGSTLRSSMDVDVQIDKSELSTGNFSKVTSPPEVKRKSSMPSKPEGNVASPNFMVSVSCQEDNAQGIPGNKLHDVKIQLPDQVFDDPKTVDSNCQSSRQSPKKLPSKGKVTYVNKKRSCSSLQLSREDVERLRNGKELTFFNSHSLTTLKVKTFKKIQIPSQMDVLMETHQNRQVRVAEVSECEANLSTCRLVEDSKNHITLSQDEPISMVEVCPFVLQVHSNAVEDSQVKEAPNFSANLSPKPLQAKIFSSPIKGGKKTKYPGSRASLAAKKRALRVARYKFGAIKGQQQVQQSRRKGGTGPNLPKMINPRFVGGKRKSLPVQNDTSTPRKKTCFCTPNPKLHGDTLCKSFSFSNFKVDGTNSCRPKPAQYGVGQASFMF